MFDTVIEDMPPDMFPDRPWGPGNNPKTAVWEFLKTHPEFEIDKNIQHKVMITVAPDGSVTNARVVRATPPRVFDREALNAVRRWKFEPIDSATTTRRTLAFNPG